MKHNKGFVPSPKADKEKKPKPAKKKGKSSSGSGLKTELVEPTIKGEEADDVQMHMDVDEKASKGKRKKGARFGSEATNRPTNAGDEEDESAQTPPKRQRLAASGEDEEWVPPKKSKKNAAEVA